MSGVYDESASRERRRARRSRYFAHNPMEGRTYHDDLSNWLREQAITGASSARQGQGGHRCARGGVGDQAIRNRSTRRRREFGRASTLGTTSAHDWPYVFFHVSFFIICYFFSLFWRRQIVSSPSVPADAGGEPTQSGFLAKRETDWTTSPSRRWWRASGRTPPTPSQPP